MHRPEEDQDERASRDLRFTQAATFEGELRNGQIISSHTLLVATDLRLAYGAGALLSVIVMACAAVEAQARQVDSGNFTKSLCELFADDEDLQWLRAIRNELVHAGEPGSRSMLWKVGGGDIAATHGALEEEATRAVKVMFRRLYASQPPPKREA